MKVSKKVIVGIIAAMFLFMVLCISNHYKTKIGYGLSNHTTVFKHHTDVYMQLVIYREEVNELLEKHKYKKPTQEEKENIKNKCDEITQYINDEFDADFNNLDLWDGTVTISVVMRMTRDLAIQEVNSSLDECLKIITKSDYKKTKNNHRFQGCLSIISECISSLSQDKSRKTAFEEKEVLEMKKQFETTIKEYNYIQVSENGVNTK